MLPKDWRILTLADLALVERGKFSIRPRNDPAYFGGDISFVQTGDVAKKSTIKLYGKGVEPKNEKRMGSESTKYFTRKAGQFIYSKLDFLNGAFDIIPKSLNGYESTLDLPAFDFKSGVDRAWFMFFVSRKEFYLSNLGLVNGGRKTRRVNPKDLLNISIACPTFPEQKRIAEALVVTERKIEVFRRKYEILNCEKKALMQQLLTGKRRVKP